MNTNPTSSVPAPSLPSGEYRLRTKKSGLKAVAERLIGGSPDVASLIDVPDESDVAAWDRLLETTDDVSDGAEEADWAMLAIPLVNALRIRCPGNAVPGSFPGAVSFLLRCPPAVAWLALRNSMAWESDNRPSGSAEGWDGMVVILSLFGLDPRWRTLFINIQKSEDFAA